MLLECMAKEGGISLLEVNPGLVIWTFIVFAIVLFLLRRFAWNPISQALDHRAEKIHGDLSGAQKLKEEAEEKLSHYLSKLDSLKEEGDKLLADRRKEGEEQRDKILVQARSEADAMLARARKEASNARDAALFEVEKYIVDLTIELASRLLETQLSAEEHRKFVDQALRNISEMKKKSEVEVYK